MPSDGWWNREKQEQVRIVRTWVRFNLLENVHAGDAEVDRLVSSLPPERAEALITHVIDQRPGRPPGF